MLKNKLHYLIGVATGTAFSYGLISAQWLQPAQAAVLTSNFEIYDFRSVGLDGFYYGTFNFDNSSITGQGRERTNVLSGVFNFLKPGFPNQPYAYDLSGGEVNFLDGKFMGLYAGGGVSSDEPMDFRIAYSSTGEPTLLSFYRRIGWSIEPMEPYGRNILIGLQTIQSGRLDTSFAGKIAYSEPAEIGTVPVPEPTTIVGTAFAFASLVQLKRKRKNLSGTS
jgi:preprotein translocase subunit Sec61beta